jgi:hypothetical protein
MYKKTLNLISLIIILTSIYIFGGLERVAKVSIFLMLAVPPSLVTAVALAYGLGDVGRDKYASSPQVQLASKFYAIWAWHQSTMIGTSALGALLFGGGVLTSLSPYMGLPLLGAGHLALQIGFSVLGGVIGALAAPGLLIAAMYFFRDAEASGTPLA